MKYVFLGKFNPEWAAKQQQRSRAARAKAKALGIDLLGVYYTQGDYDFVAITETDDVANVLAFSLWYAQKGFGRMTTLPAFDGAEIEAAVKKL